ncbi:MAG: primosomal protein N' [Tepidisphaeraceae bacterium]
MTDSLFPDLQTAPDATGEPNSVARVALERGIDKLLDYSVPKTLRSAIAVGQRVRVPLGRGDKPAFGYVSTLLATSNHGKRLKPLTAIADPRTLITDKLMQLALWVSKYYVTPLGLVLENMIPSAVKKQVGVRSVRMVRSLKTPAELQEILEATKAKKRRAILARLLQVEPGETIELFKLAFESDVKPAAVGSLAKKGIIRLERVDSYDFDHPDEPTNPLQSTPILPTLTGEQKSVLDALAPALGGGFGVHLIHGVTGSGKTEVYLRAIDTVVKSGRGAVVLVPEIALTPQTVRRFTQRFAKVAVMHSGLSQTERHRQWASIADGSAQVVVGARSGVFAPHPKLGLIVVDEEHESSYKQDTSPRYHARDVAIKRAQLEAVPILLGSATPSLEMWAKVVGGARGEGSGAREEDKLASARSETLGQEASFSSIANRKSQIANPSARSAIPYFLHSMPSRVSSRPLPAVEIVDMKGANKRRSGIHLLSPRLEQVLTWTLEQKQQAILLLNRRGYSNFIYCSSCQEPVGCKFCDKTMTYHRALGAKPEVRTTAAAVHAGQIHCHYCLAVNTLPQVCPTCGKKLSLFGLGTQRVEEELVQKFPQMTFARVDSDTMRHAKDYETLLGRFASGELQVLLGTQMLAKGLDFPNVTMVGVINGDTALGLPDFRAGERTFQLLTQVAGRAGRGEKPGRVIVQTFLPEDATIQLACSQDYLTFAQQELESRKSVKLPPFSRQVRIVLRDTAEEKVNQRAEVLAADLREAITSLALPVQLKGPMPAVVGRIAGYFRVQIVLASPGPLAIQRVLAQVRSQKSIVSSDRIAIDVDPVSML